MPASYRVYECCKDSMCQWILGSVRRCSRCVVKYWRPTARATYLNGLLLCRRCSLVTWCALLLDTALMYRYRNPSICHAIISVYAEFSSPYNRVSYRTIARYVTAAV